MSSSFLEALQTFLQKSLKEKGITTKQDLHFLQQGYEGKLSLEKELLSILSESKELNVDSFLLPKITRGLPYLYDREDPNNKKLKPRFTDLNLLKRRMVDKLVIDLYKDLHIEGSIVIFTWVIPGGFGDFMAQIKLAKAIKKAHPQLRVELVSIVHTPGKLPSLEIEFPHHQILYTGEKELLDKVVEDPILLSLLDRASFILQFPAYYPHSKELIEKMPSYLRWEFLGEYGFVESDYFYPDPYRRCMGLHFLEMGVFVEEKKSFSLSSLNTIQNSSTLSILFGKKDHGYAHDHRTIKEKSEKELEEYQKNHHLHFAYPITSRGFSIFFHCLIKYWEKDVKDIDICLPDIGVALSYFSEEKTLKGLGVKKIVFHLEDKACELSLAKVGKTVRCIHLGSLSASDYQKFLYLSDKITMCRGDQSFSDTISADKIFLYDGAPHANYFIQDLQAIARDRLSNSPKAVEFIHLFPLYKEGEKWIEKKWVEQEFFYEEISPEKIGERMGELLRDDKTILALLELNKILREEYCIEPLIGPMITRSFLHQKNPQLEKKEGEIVEGYIQGKISLKTMLERLKKVIFP